MYDLTLARFRPTTPLRYAGTEDRYSVYIDRDGDHVYLAHGTGHRMTDDIDDLDVADLWRTWCWRESRYDQGRFIAAITALLTETDQFDEFGGFCMRCDDLEPADDLYWANEDTRVCSYCLNNHFWMCVHCEQSYPDTTTVQGGSEVCDGCRNENYTYCDHCDHYYPDDYGCDDCPGNEEGECNCESPALEFQIPHVDGLLGNDERIQVSLPAGVISDTGMGSIANLLRASYYSGGEDGSYYWSLAHRLDEIGSSWQTKKGNFTKRLSRFAYQEFGLKIAPAMLSQVGNIAQAHSQGVDYHVAITRDLNRSAEYFVHGESCWWGSYYRSRCVLKSNGGFGLLSYDGHDDRWAEGRAWVMPVNFDAETEEFSHTFDAVAADAFLVFNGYGDLENYAPARILAHMVGMTYRKNQAMAHIQGYDAMYTNSGSGYLVASEEIAAVFNDTSKRIYITGDQHSDLFDAEQVTVSHTQEALRG